MSEPVEIIVRKGQQPQGTSTEFTETASVQRNIRRDPATSTVTKNAATTAILSTARTAFTQAVQHRNSLTGRYFRAQAQQQAIGLATNVAIIAKGGPIGALYVGSRIAMDAWSQHVELIQENRAIDFNLRRTGNIAIGESRYTNG